MFTLTGTRRTRHHDGRVKLDKSAEMLKKLQRQVVRKIDGHYRDGDGKWLVKVEIDAVRRLPSAVKHIKLVWASGVGKPKGSTDICAVVSGDSLVFFAERHITHTGDPCGSGHQCSWAHLNKRLHRVQVPPLLGRPWRPKSPSTTAPEMAWTPRCGFLSSSTDVGLFSSLITVWMCYLLM